MTQVLQSLWLRLVDCCVSILVALVTPNHIQVNLVCMKSSSLQSVGRKSCSTVWPSNAHQHVSFKLRLAIVVLEQHLLVNQQEAVQVITWCTGTVPSHGVLVQCLHMVYWYSAFTWCTGTVPSHGVLVQCLHMVYWYSAFTWCTGTVPSHGVLVLCLHMVYWYCAFTWYSGTVPSHGVLVQYLHMVVWFSAIT